MAPKRGATAAAAPGRPSKKSNPSTGSQNNSNDAPAPTIPRSKRWTPLISCSANVDMEYKIATQDPETAYRFVCMCRPPFRNGENDRTAKCDAGDTCLCSKPASEHPGHIWKLSSAGKRRFHAQEIYADMRCPDYFDMYTFNRHGAYGVLEVLQNLILDFEEAKDNLKERWAICEALAFFST